MSSPLLSRQIVLSVGLHKTGTTSIQKTCVQNQSALRRAGFAYPAFDFGNERISNHSVPLHMMFRTDPAKVGLTGIGLQQVTGEQATHARELLRQAVAVSLRAHSLPLIMVAEGVSTYSVAELLDMREWFAAMGCSLRVICFVRHLSSWLHSMVAQRVISPRSFAIDAAVAELVASGGLVRPRIENLRAAFPDATFESFEAATQHPRGLVGRFLDVAGVPPIADLRMARANEGRSDQVTRLFSAVRSALGPGVWMSENKPTLLRLKTLPGPKFRLLREEAAPLLPLLEAENEWLGATLGQAFQGPPAEFPEVPAPWSAEQRDRVENVVAAATDPVREATRTFLRSASARQVAIS